MSRNVRTMEATKRGRLQLLLGATAVAVIRLYLRLAGRTVRKADVPWLLGPIGPTGAIGERAYHLVAEREGLTIDRGGGASL